MTSPIRYPIRSILTGLILAACAGTLHAETFPVAEDAWGSPAKGVIGTGGKAKTLPISANGTTYLFFDVGTSGIDPANVTAARLTFFFPTVKSGGTVSLHKLATAFSEAGGTAPAPGITPFNSLTLTTADKGQYRVVDVTTEVKAWLTNSGSDKGSALTGDAAVNCQIASKEGAGSGHPPVLEVELSPPADGSVTTAKLANTSVTGAKLASNLTLTGTTTGTFSGDGSGITGITSSGLAAGSVTASKLDASTVAMVGLGRQCVSQHGRRRHRHSDAFEWRNLGRRH